jgi:cytochrome c oxidase subunit 3
MSEVNSIMTIQNKRMQSSIAMVIALISWGMLFASLCLSYTVYRFSASTWPPMGFEVAPLLLPSISTVIIFLSSFTYEKMRKGFVHSKMNSFKTYFWLTFVLGCSFLLTQYFLWNTLNSLGLYVESGIFASILHGFTWIHAAHVILGLMALLFIIPLLSLEKFNAEKEIRLINIGKFWHFLGIVWAVLFVILFLI